MIQITPQQPERYREQYDFGIVVQTWSHGDREDGRQHTEDGRSRKPSRQNEDERDAERDRATSENHFAEQGRAGPLCGRRGEDRQRSAIVHEIAVGQLAEQNLPGLRQVIEIVVGEAGIHQAKRERPPENENYQHDVGATTLHFLFTYARRHQASTPPYSYTTMSALILLSVFPANSDVWVHRGVPAASSTSIKLSR